MASLFELLLETMPFTGAANALWKLKNKKFEELSAHEAKQYIELLPEGASFAVKLPDLIEGAEPAEQPLWAWTYLASEPAAVSDLYCRVRDADHVGHKVAEHIAWGLDKPPAAFQRDVLVTFAAGGEVQLPLTKDYVLWTFHVKGGFLSEDQTRLWKLRSVLDSSLVVVFAYDVDPATGEIKKMDSARISDPILREEVEEMQEAVKSLLGMPGDGGGGAGGGSGGGDDESGKGGGEGSGPGGNLREEDIDPLWSAPPPPDLARRTSADPPPDPPPDDEEAPATGDAEPWGTKVLKGDFWTTAQFENAPPGVPPVTASGGVSGKVGEIREISTEPARLLVVFSFTTCCERADFEPGGIVGFARCYPHLLVSATVPVRKIEASVRMDRPKELERWKEGDRDMKASCCKPPYDSFTPAIGGLLVTDANECPSFPEPIPFWSNMFFYHMVDPYNKAPQRQFHLVRGDRTWARQSTDLLVQRKVEWIDPPSLEESGIVKKEARQGEFDNMHLAPRLKLMNVASASIVVPSSALVSDSPLRAGESIDDENRKKWHFDEIAMAPFCAHDCFHMHWRWSTFATAKSSLGWDHYGPYRVAGAPMVPHEQDVWLRFRERAAVTYHVLASQPVFIHHWHVLMHHGFGYAVSIADALRFWMAMSAIRQFAGFELRGERGESIDQRLSTAAYYWTARYRIVLQDGKLRPVERLSCAPEDLEKAMDL